MQTTANQPLTRLDMVKAMCETNEQLLDCLHALRTGELTTADVRAAYDQYCERESES